MSSPSSPCKPIARTGPAPWPFNLTRVEIAQPIGTLEVRSTFIATVDEAQLDLHGQDIAIAEVALLALGSTDFGARSPVHYLYPSPLLPEVDAIAGWAGPAARSRRALHRDGAGAGQAHQGRIQI